MVIIKIDKKPRYKNVYYVFFDDGERVEVFDEFIISYHLKVSRELSNEEVEEIVCKSQEKIGQQFCMQTLARGMKTKKELVQKLKEKGITKQEIVNKILDKISGYGYLDDDKFTQNYIAIEKGRKGLNKIKFELEQKGVDYKTINKYLNEVDCEDEVALEIANKYMRNKELTYKNKTKLYAHLVSKGFSFDVVSSVIQKFDWKKDDYFED